MRRPSRGGRTRGSGDAKVRRFWPRHDWSAPLVRAVAALGVTQIVGWGTTFYLPAILSREMTAGTGLSPEFVFGGVTIMLLVGAAVAAPIGRRLKADGTRSCMMLGSALIGLGLVVLSAARGPFVYTLGWVVIGVAVPMALMQAGSTSIIQVDPSRARRGIAVLFLFSGLSSTACWPLLIWLQDWLGWRGTCLVAAGLHIGLCLPLHAFGLPSRRRARLASAAGPDPGAPVVPPRAVPHAFGLAALAFSTAGFISWGLPLHILAVLRELGHSEGSALAIGALLGPGQMLARLFEILGGARLGILATGVLAAALMPVALAILLLGGGATAIAIAFVVAYGASAGLMSIVRAVTPLHLFGSEAYAVSVGRLSVPQNIAFAAGPFLFAATLHAHGVAAFLTLGLAAALLSLGAMVTLWWRAAPPDRVVAA